MRTWIWLVVVVLMLLPLGTTRVTAEEKAGGYRLADARSPYLRQHAGNPVTWYPWGQQALAAARARKVPIFAVVGSAATHRSRHMGREAFEDAEVAARLNESFVCVLVDRDERPDLHRSFLEALAFLGRPGEAPMTLALTPEGDPWWGQTYRGREDLLARIRQLRVTWRRVRGSHVRLGEETAAKLRARSAAPAMPREVQSDRALLRHYHAVISAHIGKTGGIHARGQRPPYGWLLYALEQLEAGRSFPHLIQLRATLDQIAAHGMHDHVGGGFHEGRHRRPSEGDPRWEKRLCDNALLARIYAQAARILEHAPYARVARRTIAFVERELALEAGGYACALDAETAGVDGATYTWTRAEFDQVLGRDARLGRKLFSLNFRIRGGPVSGGPGRLRALREGRHGLEMSASLEEQARERYGDLAKMSVQRDRIVARLYEHRAQRTQPLRDDRIILGWNALYLGALSEAARSLGDATYLPKARALWQFLRAKHLTKEQGLLRFPVDAGPRMPAFCEDYVFLGEAAMLMSRAETGAAAAVMAQEARFLAEAVVQRFGDRANGGLFASAAVDEHAHGFGRGRVLEDGLLPAYNGVGLWLCLAASKGQGDPLHDFARSTLRRYSGVMASARIHGLGTMFRALASDTRGKPTEVRGQRTLRQGVITLQHPVHAVVGTSRKLTFEAQVVLDAPYGLAVAGSKEVLGDGQAPTVALIAPGGARITKSAWRPIEAPPGVSGNAYRLSVEIALPARAPGARLAVTCRVGLQACTQGRCLTPTSLDMKLSVRRQ